MKKKYKSKRVEIMDVLMDFPFLQHDYSRSWMEFIAGQNESVKTDVHPDIYNSWLHSKNAGVDPLCSFLPASTRDYNRAVAINEEWDLRKSSYTPHVKQLLPFLESSEITLFYCDEDLRIIVSRGSDIMTQSLEAHNIGIGTCLKEEKAGTNAAALAYKRKRPVALIGCQHYCAAFHDYACLAYPYIGNDTTAYRYMLFFCPKERYSDMLYPVIQEHASLLTTSWQLKKEQYKSISFQKEVGELMSQNNQGCIFIDHFGNITWINSKAEKMVGLQSEDCIGLDLGLAIPALSFTKNYLSEKEAESLKEVIINTKRLYVDAILPTHSEFVTGMMLILRDGKKINRAISRIARLYARYHLKDILGDSDHIKELKARILRIADNHSSVLIIGESGTGKELVAQAIHNESSRKAQPFVALNCASIPRDLIGSELFGYEEGSFTGAKRGGALGKFELAQGGTLFLDEIGEMPLDMQAVLLRALEERSFTRIGGTVPISLDVRIIAATNQDLLQAVQEKRFRSDLYYRLNVVLLNVPPLRERTEDIILLARHFLKEFSASLNKSIDGFSPEAEACLLRYNWPGNIRELRNVVERMANYTDSAVISSNLLPPEMTGSMSEYDRTSNSADSLPSLPPAAEMLIREKEKEYKKILELMKKNHGNKSMTAKELGWSRPTLYKKLAELRSLADYSKT